MKCNLCGKDNCTIQDEKKYGVYLCEKCNKLVSVRDTKARNYWEFWYLCSNNLWDATREDSDLAMMCRNWLGCILRLMIQPQYTHCNKSHVVFKLSTSDIKEPIYFVVGEFLHLLIFESEYETIF